MNKQTLTKDWKGEFNKKFTINGNGIVGRGSSYHADTFISSEKIIAFISSLLSKTISETLDRAILDIKNYAEKLDVCYGEKLPFVILGQKCTEEEAKLFFTLGMEQTIKTIQQSRANLKSLKNETQ